ncbi:MAG: Mpo1-like protein, partial [bacterium]
NEFYPFYLSQHRHPVCQKLHVIGSLMVLLILALSIATFKWVLLWSLPVIGYGFAWVGHYFFEHNKPATFEYPLYSFMGDWKMLYDTLSRKL